MKISTIICCILIAFPLLSYADSFNENNTNHDAFLNEYRDLKSELYELKHDFKEQIQDQQRTISKQIDVIADLELKIKDLESQLFQTTQSLRNLEEEVWDIKDASNQKMKTGEK